MTTKLSRCLVSLCHPVTVTRLLVGVKASCRMHTITFPLLDCFGDVIASSLLHAIRFMQRFGRFPLRDGRVNVETSCRMHAKGFPIRDCSVEVIARYPVFAMRRSCRRHRLVTSVVCTPYGYRYATVVSTSHRSAVCAASGSPLTRRFCPRQGVVSHMHAFPAM